MTAESAARLADWERRAVSASSSESESELSLPLSEDPLPLELEPLELLLSDSLPASTPALKPASCVRLLSTWLKCASRLATWLIGGSCWAKGTDTSSGLDCELA